MFSYAEFYQMLRNTLLFSMLQIVFGFPAPLILSLLLNEVRKLFFKRTVQTMLYLPHFLSWVIIGGIFINFLDLNGIVNQMLGLFGIDPIYFLTLRDWFRPIIVSIGIWKEVGWGTIIYLAALAGVNPNLYEAAVVDGAGRWRQMWHITIPALTPAIVALFLLRLGNVAESNVEQILIFLNPLVRDVGEVVDTYIYRLGIENSLYSLTTAIGIFQSIIGIVLIVTFNRLSKQLTGESIY
jgi:putative aldouronate transport system permease protein